VILDLIEMLPQSLQKSAISIITTHGLGMMYLILKRPILRNIFHMAREVQSSYHKLSALMVDHAVLGQVVQED